MAIDLRQEELLNLADAARALPLVRGKRLHVSSVWRWCRNGVNGVRLEYLRLGRRIFTSRAALARFAQLLAEADRPAAAQKPTMRPLPVGSRQQAIEQAEAQLRSAGV